MPDVSHFVDSLNQIKEISFCSEVAESLREVVCVFNYEWMLNFVRCLSASIEVTI